MHNITLHHTLTSSQVQKVVPHMAAIKGFLDMTRHLRGSFPDFAIKHHTRMLTWLVKGDVCLWQDFFRPVSTDWHQVLPWSYLPLILTLQSRLKSHLVGWRKSHDNIYVFPTQFGHSFASSPCIQKIIFDQLKNFNFFKR